MSNEEEKFINIITSAWNDYKGSVTAFVVHKQRFNEDLKRIANPVQQQNFIELHMFERNKTIKIINNRFQQFIKIYEKNLAHVNIEFCNKINREIKDIHHLLSTVSEN